MTAVNRSGTKTRKRKIVIHVYTFRNVGCWNLDVE
jgi:hypothetical protein